ncbi:MAG TPA: undecaprenyl-diphosphate phosphatase [Steroidobacteraceae bacterium]|nr:undecaprenyl-diphosphate phosphatase [Steroidobacteraceae bacterium]
MDFLQALILGLVEGITEYLPVSSTGHLLIAQRLLHIPAGEAADAYVIVIQSGAILAVLGLYRGRVGQMLNGITGRDAAGLKLAINILVAFLPAALLGVLLDKRIKQHLFGVEPVIAAWVVGGALILALTPWLRRHRTGADLTQLTWKTAILIGLAQSLALWPGTSRSLVTILGGLAVGLSLAAAVEFAFLLGLLTLTAATVFTLLKSGAGMLAAYGWVALLTGFVAAWIAAALAVKWMVAWLNRHGLGLFAWWRFAAAGLAAWLLL